MEHSHSNSAFSSHDKELIKEFHSRNLSYKAEVAFFPETKIFEINVYKWTDELAHEKDDEGHDIGPLWQRVGGPFTSEERENAEEIAQENLSLLSLEKRDTHVSDELRKWVQDFSHDDSAEFLDVHSFEVFFLSENSSPQKIPSKDVRQILVVHDLYIVQENEIFHIGALQEDEIIHVWGLFPNLKEALEALGIFENEIF